MVSIKNKMANINFIFKIVLNVCLLNFIVYLLNVRDEDSAVLKCTKINTLQNLDKIN